MKRLVERLQTKESEKSEMMNIFEERLKKMREDYKTACNKIRTGLNSTIDELKEKMAGQNLTIKALQGENFKFLDQDQEMIRLKYAHDTLKAENGAVMGRLGTNETKYKLTVDSLNKFVSDIEKKNK